MRKDESIYRFDFSKEPSAINLFDMVKEDVKLRAKIHNSICEATRDLRRLNKLLPCMGRGRDTNLDELKIDNDLYLCSLGLFKQCHLQRANDLVIPDKVRNHLKCCINGVYNSRIRQHRWHMKNFLARLKNVRKSN